MTSNHSAAAPAPDARADRLARLEPGAGVGGRQAVLPDPLRVLHQRLLGAFLTGTGPPDAPVAAGLAAELGLDPPAALAALAAADLVHTDPATGSIAVAYPFSGRPTPYRVELAGGPAVFAMCAVDALGIPQMLRRDGQISSVDPTSGQPITVGVHAGAWCFQPATTVLLAGRTAAGDACDTAADWCCPYINFHTDREAADTYRRAHPGMTATLFGQAEAVKAAGQAFGGLLHSSNPQETAP
jgi:alkylmercury lyase